MATDEPKKRRIYIVGGKGKNVPRWLSAAFDYEQFQQDNSKTRDLEPDKVPDAVVVLSSWLGHEHFYGARDLAERLDIPMILSPGGWSASLKSAAELGINWFLRDIEQARRSPELTVDEEEGVDAFIDNAWREAYQREWAARQAMERRYGKDRGRFEHAQRELGRLTAKDEAAQRVIAEIRAAATGQRKALERSNESSELRVQAIQARSERVTEALIQHMSSLQVLYNVATEAYDAVNVSSERLSVARRDALAAKATLQAAMAVAEGGIPEGMGDTNVPTIAASNAGTDS